jgi:hypothetical protein
MPGAAEQAGPARRDRIGLELPRLVCCDGLGNYRMHDILLAARTTLSGRFMNIVLQGYDSSTEPDSSAAVPGMGRTRCDASRDATPSASHPHGQAARAVAVTASAGHVVVYVADGIGVADSASVAPAGWAATGPCFHRPTAASFRSGRNITDITPESGT